MCIITIIGAGSIVFFEKILIDISLTKTLRNIELRLYDINSKNLNYSIKIGNKILHELGRTQIKLVAYCGKEKLKPSLSNADFVINIMQVGGYRPSTIIDFEIPKKYGIEQTIGDTLGIGGIMRGLRTIPEVKKILFVMENVCPDALFINYTNPMAIIMGYIQTHFSIRSVGLCHSAQVCTKELLMTVGMEKYLCSYNEVIAGINHMAWLLEIEDSNGNDLYPEIKKRAKIINKLYKHNDMVRFEIMNRFGYYCTESSEHNAEYTAFFIKKYMPELVTQYNIPIDEYLKRCEKNEKKRKMKKINHGYEKSSEYVINIIDALLNDNTYSFNGNIVNETSILNLPENCCVEIPCIVKNKKIARNYKGELPQQLAALNMLNVNVQLLTIKAAEKEKKEYIYHAALLDPHLSADLSIDQIIKMCDELIDAHGDFMKNYK